MERGAPGRSPWRSRWTTVVGSRKRRYNLSGSRRRGRSAAYSTPFRFGSSTGDLGAHRGTCDVDAGTPGPRWGRGRPARGASGLGPTAALPFGGAAPAFGTDSGLEAFSRNPADVASRRRPFERTKIPEVPIDRSSRTESNYRCGRPIHREGKTNLSHDGLNPAHVPFRRVNNPTLGEFCFAMIGRADIEGSKSDVAKNAWPPQASSLYRADRRRRSPSIRLPRLPPGGGFKRGHRLRWG